MTAKRRSGQNANNILLVDDERLVVLALAHMLSAEGYHTELAGNGQEALDKVSAEEYDLIICDVRMPVMDGAAFYDQLRSVRPHLRERIVFCTGDMENPTTRGFLEASGAPFITKPFRLRNVLELVAAQLTAKGCLTRASA